MAQSIGQLIQSVRSGAGRGQGNTQAQAVGMIIQALGNLGQTMQSFGHYQRQMASDARAAASEARAQELYQYNKSQRQTIESMRDLTHKSQIEEFRRRQAENRGIIDAFGSVENLAREKYKGMKKDMTTRDQVREYEGPLAKINFLLRERTHSDALLLDELQSQLPGGKKNALWQKMNLDFQQTQQALENMKGQQELFNINLEQAKRANLKARDREGAVKKVHGSEEGLAMAEERIKKIGMEQQMDEFEVAEKERKVKDITATETLSGLEGAQKDFRKVMLTAESAMKDAVDAAAATSPVPLTEAQKTQLGHGGFRSNLEATLRGTTWEKLMKETKNKMDLAIDMTREDRFKPHMEEMVVSKLTELLDLARVSQTEKIESLKDLLPVWEKQVEKDPSMIVLGSFFRRGAMGSNLQDALYSEGLIPRLLGQTAGKEPERQADRLLAIVPRKQGHAEKHGRMAPEFSFWGDELSWAKPDSPITEAMIPPAEKEKYANVIGKPTSYLFPLYDPETARMEGLYNILQRLRLGENTPSTLEEQGLPQVYVTRGTKATTGEPVTKYRFTGFGAPEAPFGEGPLGADLPSESLDELRKVLPEGYKDAVRELLIKSLELYARDREGQ